MLGDAVATGSTDGRGNRYSSCSGFGSEVTFGWFAPAAGTYQIDMCASEEFWAATATGAARLQR